MIDQTQRELLERFLDRETSEHENQQLEKMLAASAELRALHEDYQAIRRQASSPEPDYPAGLEERLELALRRAYPQAVGPQSRRDWFSRYGPLAAGLLVILALGVTALLGLEVRSEDEGPIADSPLPDRAVIDEVLFAQEQYYLAIQELEVLAAVRMESLPAPVVQLLENNLDIINEAIQISEQSLLANDIGFHSRNALPEMYEKKIDLLTAILMI